MSLLAEQGWQYGLKKRKNKVQDKLFSPDYCKI